MADYAHTPGAAAAPATRDDFYAALADAHLISNILDELADRAITTSAHLNAAQVTWLVEQLDTRIERIEVAAESLFQVRL